MTKNLDELIRASALCGLTNLILSCRGRYFDKILQEVFLRNNILLLSF